MTKRLLLTAAVCGLLSSPAGALILCPDDAGEYTPDACDLILPVDPTQREHECDAADWARWFTDDEGQDPKCSAYWDQELAVDKWLAHELERQGRR
jgi:hypothetical protein